MAKTNLKSLSADEMNSLIEGLGQPLFRARQIIKWIYEHGVSSIGEMTDISKDLRIMLGGISYVSSLKLLNRKTSPDGTEKLLFGLEDGETIESVIIPDGGRMTLCISSQAGCLMKCGFCLTGKYGFRRNLKAFEIVDQATSIKRLLPDKTITNIVYIGMGEPLMNPDHVFESIRRLVNLMGFSKRRITVSTCGIAPEIKRLYDSAPHVRLAISLNATSDRVREKLMPINKKYPLKTLFDALRKIPIPKNERITFEYVLIDGINDSAEDAMRLVRLLRGIPSKVNVIPFNEHKGAEYKRPADSKALEFQKMLTSSGVKAFIRKSKGEDILAACGQLRGKRVSARNP